MNEHLAGKPDDKNWSARLWHLSTLQSLNLAYDGGSGLWTCTVVINWRGEPATFTHSADTKEEAANMAMNKAL